MRKLLALLAVSEALTGLLLLVYPPVVIHLLFDQEIAGAGVFMSRLAGIILIALGIACWPDSNTPVRALYGMLTYSILAMSYLAYVGANGGRGILLWPAVAVHAGLCVLLIRARLKVAQQ